MIRRYLCLLLAVQLPLTQGLGSCHTHAGSTAPAGHGQIPHVHLHPLALPFKAEQHAHHHHGHHPHQHHHAADDRDAGNKGDEGPTSGDHEAQQVPAEDHDADAVYLPDSLAMSPSAPRPDASTSFWLPHVSPFVNAAVATVPTTPWPTAMPPPVAGRFHCPVFLQTRTLLI